MPDARPQPADLCPMELRLPPIRDLNLHDEMRPPQNAPLRDERLQKVLTHCQALCAFADHYAGSPPPPNPPEVAQMVDRAVEVINILQEYKLATCPPATPAYRPPKRPWEDATEESPRRPAPSPPAESPSPTEDAPSPACAFAPAQEAHMGVFDGVPHRQPSMDEEAKAVAIRDMEDIRARRTHGQQAIAPGKTKYKKRSRATPPGYCHSCEISDTPEWRRGPDGQRTLCNACGLHYAKLVRKRDRIISALPAGGRAPPAIDIAFLRKSARLAAENSALARSAAGRRRGGDKDKPKVESPNRSAPPSTCSERARDRDSVGSAQEYSHPTSPSYLAPPVTTSPARAPVNMPMTLPPPQRYPVNYGPPSYQPFVQSGAPQSSYGMAPPPSGWNYDHHPAPAPAPAPHQWDRYMPPHPR